MIPYGRQSISQSDVEAVTSVLRSDLLTQGPVVPAFERALAERVEAGHGVATNSATSALHVACLALGVGPEDEVWTSPNSFVASANCALYCGARVDFVDIDPDTLCMSEVSLAEKLKSHRALGKALPKVVIPVHFGGQSCEMQEIHRLSKSFGFSIIEDASHAIGARYRGGPVGNCAFSDICVFSFHPVKIITTGEGGMATTQSAELYHRMARLRSHGITREPEQMTGDIHGPWYYQQRDLGLNYRLTDLQAALGLSQLGRLEEFVEIRQSLAVRYERALGGIVGIQRVPTETESARHLFPIRVPANHRLEVFNQLRANGIGVNVHYIPIYLQPYFQGLGFRSGHCPVAEHYYQEALSLPLFATLTPKEQTQVIELTQKALQLALKA